MSPLSSCLHVIDGTLPVYSESETLLLRQIGEYSRVDRILPTGSSPTPPASIFGEEPERGWCYIYQRASLARQTGDWEQIARLYDESVEQGLETDDKAEIIPFFEALINVGRIEDARALYNEQIKGNVKMRVPLCMFLEEDPGYAPEFGYDYQRINELLCES